MQYNNHISRLRKAAPKAYSFLQVREAAPKSYLRQVREAAPKSYSRQVREAAPKFYLRQARKAAPKSYSQQVREEAPKSYCLLQILLGSSCPAATIISRSENNMKCFIVNLRIFGETFQEEIVHFDFYQFSIFQQF